MKVERDSKYYLYSKDGTKKLGGPYDTEAEVWKRERQVQYFKRQGKTAMLDQQIINKLFEKYAATGLIGKTISRAAGAKNVGKAALTKSPGKAGVVNKTQVVKKAPKKKGVKPSPLSTPTRSEYARGLNQHNINRAKGRAVAKKDRADAAKATQRADVTARRKRGIAAENARNAPFSPVSPASPSYQLPPSNGVPQGGFINPGASAPMNPNAGAFKQKPEFSTAEAVRSGTAPTLPPPTQQKAGPKIDAKEAKKPLGKYILGTGGLLGVGGLGGYLLSKEGSIMLSELGFHKSAGKYDTPIQKAFGAVKKVFTKSQKAAKGGPVTGGGAIGPSQAFMNTAKNTPKPMSSTTKAVIGGSLIGGGAGIGGYMIGKES